MATGTTARLRKSGIRFGLPPSLGSKEALERAHGFAAHLSSMISDAVTVQVAPSYQTLREMVMHGEADAIWAPPFVCARLETKGLKVAVRGVRDGASAYRAALVCRKAEALKLTDLKGKTAAWVDPDSVGGHILVLAMLSDLGLDAAKLFREQHFLGSYRSALLAVAEGTADVASIFATPTGDLPNGVEDVLPGKTGLFGVVAFSEPSPNDGVILAPSLAQTVSQGVTQALLGMHQSDDGRALLGRAFRIERFEPAPPSSYRALYRLAVAAL